MKWMIASDLHGSAFYCKKMIKAFERERADRLLLLGDLLYHGPRNDLPEGYAPKEVIPLLNSLKPELLCVRGNCDAEVDQMVLEFPVPFAPSFYGLDFSELPALIGAFAYGPVAGVMIEFCKILIKLVLKPSSTAFVGELANFSISCMLVLPASVIYLFKKSRKQAILGTVVGTLIMTAFGSCFNAIYLLPKFSELYGIPLDAIIGMGTAINPAIHSISGLVLMCVVPLNLLKGGLVSLITILVYKKLSPILKAAHK